MDYIREELLRQQALLVVLLTGQRLEPLEETEKHSRTPAADLLQADAEESRLWEEVREAVGARRSRRGTGVGQSRGSTWEEPAEAAALLWTALAAGRTMEGQRSPEWEELRETAAGRKAETNAAAVMSGRGGSAVPAEIGQITGAFPAETGEVRLVTELRQAERGESADPAALSLAFQRDARRYDGGFRLY